MGALVGSYTVDKIGRRRQLLYATGLCAVMLATVAGLLSKT
jgi:hypothetical protein